MQQFVFYYPKWLDHCGVIDENQRRSHFITINAEKLVIYIISLTTKSGIIPHLITCQKKLLSSYLLLCKLSVLPALNVITKISIGREPLLQAMSSVGFHEDWLFKGV